MKGSWCLVRFSSFVGCYSLTEVYRLLLLSFPMEEYRLQFQETITIIIEFSHNISRMATSPNKFLNLNNLKFQV